MHRLKSHQLGCRNLVLGDDGEVDIAVLVGIADGERALQVPAAEVVPENRRRARDQVTQHLVELREHGRHGHLSRYVSDP